MCNFGLLFRHFVRRSQRADTWELTVQWSAREDWHPMAALIMLGTLSALIVLVFALVLRYDPEARGPERRDP